MTLSALDRAVCGPPATGRISFARLDRTDSYELAELHDTAARLAAGLRDAGSAPATGSASCPATGGSGCCWTSRRCGWER